MRQIGLHLRLVGSLRELAQRAVELQVPFFQFFLVQKTSGNLIQPTESDIQEFLALRRQHFGAVYIHGSYWINLAGLYNTGHHALRRELRLAKTLECTHMILHAGSAKGATCKDEGIDALARSLNTLLRYERDIKIVLENSAHGALSVGGDIQDFALLLTKIDHPEKLSFCIDTAHAYSYGYDLSSDQGREQFIELLSTTIGINNIVLIHLNDTTEKLGSKLDKHASVGTGRIGSAALQLFVLDERIRTIPLLMELPILPVHEEQEVLDMVRGWHQQ